MCSYSPNRKFFQRGNDSVKLRIQRLISWIIVRFTYGNKKALESAILFGVSVKGKISKETVFSRKNYFYPDLPKGYQISQLDKPIVLGGSLKLF